MRCPAQDIGLGGRWDFAQGLFMALTTLGSMGRLPFSISQIRLGCRSTRKARSHCVQPKRTLASFTSIGLKWPPLSLQRILPQA